MDVSNYITNVSPLYSAVSEDDSDEGWLKNVFVTSHTNAIKVNHMAQSFKSGFGTEELDFVNHMML